jgi:hypothetical protein
MLLERLKEIGIIDALSDLGFSIEEMFSGVNSNNDSFYNDNYNWVKSDCHVDCIDKEYVINAIPKDFSSKAWEEWYASDGKLVHHVLCQEKWPECTDEAFIEANDTNHPDEIKGKKWFYFEDIDMRPYFAR